MPRHKVHPAINLTVEDEQPLMEESVEEETFDTNEVLEPTIDQDKEFEKIVMEVKPSTDPEPNWEVLQHTMTFIEYHKLRVLHGKD